MQATITDSVLVALAGLLGVIALLFLTITRFKWHVFAALLIPILLFALLPGIDRKTFIEAFEQGFGRTVQSIAVVIVLGYVAVKWIQRRRFLRSLRVARITQEALRDALAAGTPPLIVDLRTALDVDADPYVIPGALRIAPEELAARHAEIPRDRDIVVYCS